jgi:hypothetical protein
MSSMTTSCTEQFLIQFKSFFLLIKNCTKTVLWLCNFSLFYYVSTFHKNHLSSSYLWHVLQEKLGFHGEILKLGISGWFMMMSSKGQWPVFTVLWAEDNCCLICSIWSLDGTRDSIIIHIISNHPIFHESTYEIGGKDLLPREKMSPN